MTARRVEFFVAISIGFVCWAGDVFACNDAERLSAKLATTRLSATLTILNRHAFAITTDPNDDGCEKHVAKYKSDLSELEEIRQEGLSLCQSERELFDSHWQTADEVMHVFLTNLKEAGCTVQ